VAESIGGRSQHRKYRVLTTRRRGFRLILSCVLPSGGVTRDVISMRRLPVPSASPQPTRPMAVPTVNGESSSSTGTQIAQRTLGGLRWRKGGSEEDSREEKGREA
jgi:hypothetical protein